MKKLTILLFFFIALNAQAQYTRPSDSSSYVPPSNYTPPLPKPTFADRLSIGGSFGLQFGDITFIALEPLVNYHFNSSFMIGIGPIYQYENVNPQAYGFAFTSSIYGGRITALYFLPDELSRVFLMGDYDLLNVPEVNYYSYELLRGYLSLPMLGIGYKEQVSDKVFFCIYGLWNFNNSPYSPFANPIINAGFDVGLWH